MARTVQMALMAVDDSQHSPRPEELVQKVALALEVLSASTRWASQFARVDELFDWSGYLF
jgi:hypothetical protein